MFGELFEILTTFFLQVINFTHQFTNNFGWDIIILTLAVKLALFPLTLASTKSMKRMQELQPELKALQEKFKDQKEKQSAAMLELYRKNKINPLSGCLPMLLQLPVFLALFQMLSDPSRNGYLFVNSFFYKMDLTTPAFMRLTDGFFANVKMMLPYMISVDITQAVGQIPVISGLLANGYLYLPTATLVVLMGVTTFLQQKSMTMDPNQANTMIFMNIFIVFIALSMPAGVLLYWVVSNLLQFVQQKIVKTSVPTPAAATAGTGEGKAGSAASGDIRTTLSKLGVEKGNSGGSSNNKKKKKR